MVEYKIDVGDSKEVIISRADNDETFDLECLQNDEIVFECEVEREDLAKILKAEN